MEMVRFGVSESLNSDGHNWVVEYDDEWLGGGYIININLACIRDDGFRIRVPISLYTILRQPRSLVDNTVNHIRQLEARSTQAKTTYLQDMDGMG